MRKKVYISGKMTGLPDLNRPKFKEAESRLRDSGFLPLNPHDIHPANTSHYTWADFMRADIKALMDCDMIAVLDDWKLSPGANMEVKIALALGMPMLCAHTLVFLECDDQAQCKRVPNKHVMKELKRELDMRKRHYPQWITMGRMTKPVADHRIEVIEQLLNDCKDVKYVGGSATVQPVQSQGNLF